MKNLQVRFADEAYKVLEQIARDEYTTIADIVRKSIQLYGITQAYRKEGKTLGIVDGNHVQAHLVIPGFAAIEPTPEVIGGTFVTQRPITTRAPMSQETPTSQSQAKVEG